MMTSLYKYIAVLAASLCCLLPLLQARAQDDTVASTQQLTDTVDRNADDFVTVSILFAQPGGALYSRFGHVGLRMQCPSGGLDLVYSYESEDAASRVMSFLAGKLLMGLFAIPTEEYLGLYAEEDRGVKEYELNLPIWNKRNLWRVLDGHVAEGIYLPYDYITRGCAHSTLQFLCEGLEATPLVYGSWPEKFTTMTRRELAGLQMKDSPWCWAFLNLICNGSIDATCSKSEKVIMPVDLIDVLSHATVQGQPVLKGTCVELLPDGPGMKAPLITPTMVAIALLLLTVVAAFVRWRFVDYVLLALQTLIGLVTVYLVCFSSLCCTEWSWLIIPFNPLPLVCWKWRKHWALPFALLIVAWCLFIAFAGHRFTDTPFVLLALALAVNYANLYLRNRNTKQTNR